MKMHLRMVLFVVVIIVVALVVVYLPTLNQNLPQTPATQNPIATASYVCNQGKTITAAFYRGESKPAPTPNLPPTPGGSVKLDLSDGRKLTLAQTISADGGRYANPDESFVFWSKGNGALVLENNQEKSYIGCIEVKSDPGGLPQVYENGSEGFSIRYPSGYTVDANYRYQALGPTKEIVGIAFTVPSSLATGTNLGSDSYISVEQIPNSGTSLCTADRFLNAGYVPITPKNVTDGNTAYSVASSSDAGLGNRYEETVFALTDTNPCVAVRYFIHYSVIDNYPAGTVKQFDHAALVNQFDQIRRTLVVNQ